MHISSRATALAILSVKNGLDALKTNSNGFEVLKTIPTPLQLLIKEMPGENLPSIFYAIYTTLMHVIQHQSSHVILIE